VFLDGNYHAW
jgi:hypothetical protein